MKQVLLHFSSQIINFRGEEVSLGRWEQQNNMRGRRFQLWFHCNYLQMCSRDRFQQASRSDPESVPGSWIFMKTSNVKPPEEVERSSTYQRVRPRQPTCWRIRAASSGTTGVWVCEYWPGYSFSDEGRGQMFSSSWWWTCSQCQSGTKWTTDIKILLLKDTKSKEKIRLRLNICIEMMMLQNSLRVHVLLLLLTTAAPSRKALKKPKNNHFKKGWIW